MKQVKSPCLKAYNIGISGQNGKTNYINNIGECNDTNVTTMS